MKFLNKLKKKTVEIKGAPETRDGKGPCNKSQKDLNVVKNKEENNKTAAKMVEGAEKKTVEEKRSFEQGLVSTKDIIAPAALEVDTSHIRVGDKYYRTLFVAAYPRFVGLNWLSPLINFDASLAVSMYVYPTDGKDVLDDLRRKIAEMGAEISTDVQRGRVINPATQAKLEDALTLQAELVKGEERFFQFGLYITISTDSIDRLNQINKNLEAALGALMIISKRTTWQMEEGFTTTLPLCRDSLNVTRNMDTTSLATTFPFVSSDLSDDKGIMYGINEHNGSLVIFDRFSMPNYNSVVFATSGVGKSYLIKLEAIRSLMMGTDVIVIDPENEYKNLCEAVGGQYIAFGYGEGSKINPFDLTLAEEKGENALNTKILSLHKLFKVMLGKMDPLEESILDKALMAAYKAKGITPDPETQNKEAPLIEDLYKALIGTEDEKAQGLAARLEKFIKGSFSGIFNQKTTVDLKNKFVVFGIRDLEESLRPVAMHIVLDYIWTTVKKNLKKRILVVDEAWYLMQHDDSAMFLRGIIKRGRKYFLGTTTITQDVDDFLETPYGKEIVTNSAIQILLKQHSAAIDKVAEIFYLSEGEKQLLLSADKGEGIFFAGQNHVALRVIASEEEHNLITSNPDDLVKQKAAISKKLEEVKSKKEEKPGLDVRIKNEAITEAKTEAKTVPVARSMPPGTGVDEVIRPVEKQSPTQAVSKLSASAGKDEKTARPTPKNEMMVNEKVETKKSLTETDLEERIKKMEAEESKKLSQVKAEGQKPNKGVLFQNPQGADKTKRYIPPKAEAVTPNAAPTWGGVNKPIFVNKNQEKRVPQPPQLVAKKPKVEFVKPKEKTGLSPLPPMGSGTKKPFFGKPVASSKPEEKRAETARPPPKITEKTTGTKKPDYDELLGN